MLRELNVADFLPPEKKQEKNKVESTSVEDSPASRAAPGSLTPGDDSVRMDVDRSADGEGKEIKEIKETHASVKYKMTEAMKGRIQNEKKCVRVQSDHG
jgi:hypothetical protein